MMGRFSILFLAISLLFPVASCRASQVVSEEIAPAAVETRVVKVSGSFNSVKASSIFNVEIVQGPVGIEVTSTPEGIDATRFSVADGVLSVSLASSKDFRNSYADIKVKISMPVIAKLDGGGASNFTVKGNVDVSKLHVIGAGACNFRFEGALKCTELDVDLAGASNMDCPSVDCRECEIGVSGGTSVDIDEITCREFDVDASGAGRVMISEVKCDAAEVDASGGTNVTLVTVNAKKLTCKASGAAHVTVAGKCNDVTLNASGASKISTRKLKGNSVSESKSGVATIRR